MNLPTELHRCAWATTDLGIAYHDAEWGVPVHDDRLLFEFLILEGAQAGLSWETILRKRIAYREALDNFDPRAVARYTAGTRTDIRRSNRCTTSAPARRRRAWCKPEAGNSPA